jgi:hypothetical protein
MTKFEQLQNQTEASYPSAEVVAEITRAVLKELGDQSFKPADTLVDRVNAWQRMRQESRPETHTADGRPIITVSPEAQWGAPCLNELGADNVIRPKQQPMESWQDGFELNQARLRMAGHFNRNRLRAIYTEAEDKSESPGPNIPVNSEQRHKISW